MNYIIIAILALVLTTAILRAVKHFKGDGGSGSNTIRDKKTLT